MQNLTYTQKRILDKLLPPLEKKIEDQEQLNRVCKVYRMAIEEERDPYLIQQFIICVESNLYRLLQRESKFYNAGYFKDNYKVLVNNFIEDNIDAVEGDFIVEYTNSQQEIIDKTFKRYINVEGYEALEVTQFVSKGFFDDFIQSSKKKIEFLKDLSKVKEKKKLSLSIKNKEVHKLFQLIDSELEIFSSGDDFINATIKNRKQTFHLNIDNRNFHYIITVLKPYFYNFEYGKFVLANKIYTKRKGNLLKVKNFQNSKGETSSKRDLIDKIVNNFKISLE